jgi:Ca2+-binding EF-hand superfamily protein
MMFALGAATSIFDSLQALTSSSSSSASSSQGGTTSAFQLGSSTQASATPTTGLSGGNGGFSGISPQTMSALLDAQSQSGTTTSTSTSPSDALQNLFNDIDSNGDGSITKSEFESALGAGGTNLANADKVFGELDSNGDGSVSMDELKSALQGAGGHHGGHHHMHAGASSSSTDSSADGSTDPNADPLMQALAAASSTSGSSSTTDLASSLKIIDKSQLQAISLNGTSSANSSYNMLQQALARAEQSFSNSASSSLSVNV